MSILDDILGGIGSGFSSVGNALGSGLGDTGQQAMGAAKKIFSTGEDLASSNVDPLSGIGAPKFSIMDVLNAPASAVRAIPGEQSLPGPARAVAESAAYAIPAFLAAIPTGGASLSDLVPAAARLGLYGLGGYGAQEGAKALGAGQGGQTAAGIAGQVATDVLTHHIGPFATSEPRGPVLAAADEGTQAHLPLPEEPAPAASPAMEPFVVRSDALRQQFTDQNGYFDMKSAATAVSDQAQRALSQGQPVTMYIEGKPISITSVRDGVMYDAEGKRWGVGGLAMPKPGEDARIEFGRTAPAASPTGNLPPTTGGVAAPPLTQPAGAAIESQAQRAQRIASAVLNQRAASIATDAGYGHLVDWEVPGERLTTGSYSDIRNPQKTGGRDFYAEAGSAAGMPLVPRSEAVYDPTGQRVGFVSPDGREFLFDRDERGGFTGSSTQLAPGSLEDMGYIRGPQAINAPSGNTAEAIARAEATADRIAGGAGFGAPNGRSFEDYAIRDSNAGRQFDPANPPRDAGPMQPGSTGRGGGRGNVYGPGGAFDDASRGGQPPNIVDNPNGAVSRVLNEVNGIAHVPTTFQTIGPHPFRIGAGLELSNPSLIAKAEGAYLKGWTNPTLLAHALDEQWHAPYIGGEGPVGYRWADFQHAEGGPMPEPVATAMLKTLTGGEHGVLARNQLAFAGRLDMLKQGAYEMYAEKLERLGITDQREYLKAYQAIQHAGGQAFSAGRTPQAASLTLYAQAGLARLATLGDLIFGTGVPGFTGSRTIALKALLADGALDATILGISALVGAKVMLPAAGQKLTTKFGINSKIGKAVSGTTSIDPSTGYLPLIRFVANLANDYANKDQGMAAQHIQDFARGQLGPIPGQIANLVIGKDYQGKPFTWHDLGTQKNLADLFSPLGAKAMFDALTTQTGNPYLAAWGLGGVSTTTTEPNAHFLQVMPNGNAQDYDRYQSAVNQLSPYFDTKSQAADLAWETALKQHPEWAQYDGLNGSKRFDGLAEALAMPKEQGGAGMAPDAAYKLMQHLAGPYFGFMSYAEQRYLNEHPELIPILREWQYAIPRALNNG